MEERFSALSRTPARLYKMVVLAANPGDGVAPLLLAASEGRDDLLAFAAGRSCTWTRLLAARYGAGVVYGAAAASSVGAPGQITVEELVRDFGLPELPPVRAFYGILGNPVVSASLSPRLHNGAYRELGLHAAYLPFEADSLGARIAQRAGYDALRGVLYFQDAADPGNRFLGTHPPNADRIRVVRQAVSG